MGQANEGGSRRIDRILDPAFLEGLGELDMDEVRNRRDTAWAEREYLSFLRRQLQARRDILQDELERRHGGGRPGSVVERLTAVLADAPRGPSRGEAVVLSIPEEEVVVARRRVERLVSDARLSDLERLTEEDIRETVAAIDREERAVSDLRTRVMSVHDAVQDELKRRYRVQLKDLRG